MIFPPENKPIVDKREHFLLLYLSFIYKMLSYLISRGVATLGSSRHVPTHNFHNFYVKYAYIFLVFHIFSKIGNKIGLFS